MIHSTQTPSYPYLYSERVVEAFVEKYARATIFFAKKLGMSPKHLKMLLTKQFRTANARWNVTRDVIKWIHTSNAYNYLKGLDQGGFIFYLTAVKYMAEDEVIFEKKSYAAIDSGDFSNDDYMVE